MSSVGAEAEGLFEGFPAAGKKGDHPAGRLASGPSALDSRAQECAPQPAGQVTSPLTPVQAALTKRAAGDREPFDIDANAPGEGRPRDGKSQFFADPLDPPRTHQGVKKGRPISPAR